MTASEKFNFRPSSARSILQHSVYGLLLRAFAGICGKKNFLEEFTWAPIQTNSTLAQSNRRSPLRPEPPPFVIGNSSFIIQPHTAACPCPQPNSTSADDG